MLLLLKDLLAKFIITYTLKDKLTTWLCLVDGYLASLHDLVSFMIEHTICSRVRCVTNKNTIDRPSLKRTQLLPFLHNKALATKDMEVTHLGCATVHQLVACFLLGVLCSSGIIRAISHKVLFFLSTTPFWEAYTDSKTGVQDPSHGKKLQNESF
jgi:hypothetical protein